MTEGMDMHERWRARRDEAVMTAGLMPATRRVADH
jgi:hypothetical protein